MARLNVGIFGGTFDPPHLGHLVLAAEAQHQLCLDRILWVLTPNPPHKQNRPITPLSDRLEMLKAALEGNPVFELSRVDIDRPPPHYALDTLRILRSENPSERLIYLIGEDSLRDMPDWHNPREFVAACDGLGVMRRFRLGVNLAQLKEKLPGITTRLQMIEAPLLEVSSSEIRYRITQGRPFRYFLPPEVYRIIQERHLYQTD